MPREIPDRELFSLLSDFYLNPNSEEKIKTQNDQQDTPRDQQGTPLGFTIIRH